MGERELVCFFEGPEGAQELGRDDFVGLDEIGVVVGYEHDEDGDGFGFRHGGR